MSEPPFADDVRKVVAERDAAREEAERLRGALEQLIGEVVHGDHNHLLEAARQARAALQPPDGTCDRHRHRPPSEVPIEALQDWLAEKDACPDCRPPDGTEEEDG